jgi:hypothetical protein
MRMIPGVDRQKDRKTATGEPVDRYATTPSLRPIPVPPPVPGNHDGRTNPYGTEPMDGEDNVYVPESFVPPSERARAAAPPPPPPPRAPGDVSLTPQTSMSVSTQRAPFISPRAHQLVRRYGVAAGLVVGALLGLTLAAALAPVLMNPNRSSERQSAAAAPSAAIQAADAAASSSASPSAR